MKAGDLVEFIHQQQIITAVVMDTAPPRLRLLTEDGSEIQLAAGRVAHRTPQGADPSLPRSELVARLRQIAANRQSLGDSVDVAQLWQAVKETTTWIDLPTLADHCFPNHPRADEQSAVMRALFQNRFYFQFDTHRFLPLSPNEVTLNIARHREAIVRKELIDAGSVWLKALTNGNADRQGAPDTTSPEARRYMQILESAFLHERDSPHYPVAREMMAAAGLSRPSALFDILVRTGVFDADENLDLRRLNIPVDFPGKAESRAIQMAQRPAAMADFPDRTDLTHLPLITIDGQFTADFDDALSLEEIEDGYRLGVHIADVAHYVHRDDPIDRAARSRASSIYTPDQRIPMLPTALAENLCSLRVEQPRPAISLMVCFTREFKVLDYSLAASWIRVERQWSYYDANHQMSIDPELGLLRQIAQHFRQARLAEGAVHIGLPETSIWFDEMEQVNLNLVNRESPGRMLVAELMIMANWLMARHLAQAGLPAVFRSQGPPRERLYDGQEATLFQFWMQRRHLSRFALSVRPVPHAGLGLNAYITATSPIRKYYDLLNQRQLRATLGLEAPYTESEVTQLIQDLEKPMAQVGLVQRERNRYWLLKLLEDRIGQSEPAIILQKRRRDYQVLLVNYMIECDAPDIPDAMIPPGTSVTVTVQEADARANQLRIELSDAAAGDT